MTEVHVEASVWEMDRTPTSRKIKTLRAIGIDDVVWLVVAWRPGSLAAWGHAGAQKDGLLLATAVEDAVLCWTRLRLLWVPHPHHAR